MAIKKKFKTRLDLIQEELDNQVYVVEENGKKVADSRNPNLPLYYTNKRLDAAKNNDIAPVRTTNTSSSKKKNDDTWLSKGAFSDGYDFGDVTKTILGTTGDVVTNVTKSLFSLGEGIGDAVNYGIAGIADLTGNDRFADDLRTGAAESLADKIFNPAEELYDKYSVLGEKSDHIAQGLGYVGGIVATGGMGASTGLSTAGTTALTTGVTGVSSFGSGVGEAYQGGATDGEAHLYGLINGVAEAGTELIFGGLGKSVNALGLSKGLSSADDMLAKTISSKISNQLAKNLAEYTVKAGAEGLEEVMSGVIQGIGKKVTYMSEEELGKIMANEQLLDQFIMGAVTSGIAQAPGLVKTTKAGRDFVSNYTDNEQKVVDSLVEEQSNELSRQKAIENAINEAIRTRETEQQGILSTKEKTALTEGIKAKIENGEIDVSNTKLTNKEISKIRQEVENNLQQGLLDTNKIDSILGNTITEKDGLLARSYQETAKRSQNFTYDSNQVTNEQEKAVYDSAAKYFNDTTRSHEFVEKVAKISKDKGTNYGFINNEELKSLGHDVEGKQVNGLVRTSQDGKQTVLINVDSPKALNTIVGHETTHLLEGTTEYQELQEAIFNYAKEKGDFDSRQKALNSLYEGIENANIDSELTADLVGDYLFTDEKFIDSLSTQKPTVFQKIKSLIDDLVIKFKGTKEEKALREVQKKFKEAYRKNSQSTEDTQYAVSEAIKGLNENQLKIINGEIDVYHGTDADITEMTSSKGKGMNFFSTNPKISKTYSKKGNVNSNRIKMTNPLVIEGNGAYYNQIEFQGGKYKTEQIANWARENGYDGVVFKNIIDQGGKNLSGIKQGESRVSDVFVTFDSSQSQVVEKGVKFSISNNVETMTADDAIDTMRYLDSKESLTRDERDTQQSIINKFIFDEKFVQYMRGKLNDTDITPTKQKTNIKKYDTKQSDIQGLENYKESDIEDAIFQDIENKLAEYGYGDEDIEIDSLYLHGSRKRGTAKDTSDLDVVLFYTGEANDIDLFNSLNENRLNIDGIEIDVNPINLADESSESYIARSEKYDKEVIANGGIKPRYSLSDNTGRNLSEYTLEKTKNSKVRDEKGNLMLMYHGSPDGNYDQLKAGTYFTSDRKYAERYTSTSASSLGNGRKITNNPKIYEAYLNIEKPFNLNDPEARNIYINDYIKGGNALGINPYLSDAEYNEIDNIDWTEVEDLKDFLQENGYDYDGIVSYEGADGGYGSEVIDRGESYIPFSEKQIIKANEDNTKYSLTPDYGMSHRPSTDYGDASNFEENMPDVFEHPEWYMFGGDDWYKKAYKESLNALRKVRNNPEGEITIYRATIGDTFNEGDWVSPSKAYAEWHNYSNLEGKGKVIELKVKAKEIRFAGDDLNEFGYFPNGVDEYSLSRFDEQRAEAKGNYNVYGEDVKLQETIAPLQEEIQTLTETVQELKEQIAPVKEENAQKIENIVQKSTEVEYTQPTKAELDNLMALQETGGTEYANTFFGLRDKYGQPKLYKGINEYKKAPDTYEAPIKNDEFAPTPQNIVEQQNAEAFNNIDESNIPRETDDYIPSEESKMTSTESLFETRNYEDVGSRKVNAYQYDNPEVKPFFQQEAQAMLGDLKASIKGQRQYNDDLYYSSGGEQGFYGTERQTTNDIAELLDGMDGKYKYSYADIEKGLNAIINDKGAENNAVSKRIEFYLDQRLREGYITTDGIEIPANQDYINMMAVKEMNDYYNSLPITDDMIPGEYVEKPVDNVSNSESIAPIKKLDKSTPRTTETSKPEPINKAYQLTIDGKAEKVIDNSTYKEIAEVLTNEPTTESQRNKRKWAIFKANVFDKGAVFEDLSLKENNRELMGKWDYTLTSEARGQYAIGNGHNGLSKSLNDIRAEVDNTGNTKDFYNYMYHKHNVDRMTLDKRYGVENKPVFGESVTAAQSQAIVNQYEKTHPEFMDFAQDVYDYVNADKQLLVDNGVISQETADLWSKMYPHYVPTRRTTDTGIDINVPLDTRKTGINAPIKKATGGSADILPLFDTLAMRTLQTYRATAKNSFGVELMNTLGTKVESNQTNVDEVIDSIEAQEELLQEGKKGNSPTFTVFENGEKHTFEITKDMYDALKPLDESSFLSKTIKPLNTASNIRRGLLTEYNPTFLLTNAIKDTQDILINSQHVAKTYSKIPEAHKQLLTKGYWYQEYVANGGEQNSYFDNETNTFKTENKGLAKIMDLPPLSTISKLNNHIEMIPRLAEYIASRESGRSIEVSMLDAARVTTNFKAGGAVTKWANRNGATFLNASVQGAMQQVRNIREAKANGVRGWVNLATKFAIAGLPAILLNNFVWDDDEEYEDLSNYVKQNYYIVGKTDNGTFIRIPKGRTVAVIQEGLNQMGNLVTGNDEVDLKSFIDLTINNLAPNNPLDNNIFSPITQVATNTAWYGGDLLPTRLQDLPAAEQYDESTDMFSRWIGETFNVSPYKVNYLLDQYSGGVGDVLLPMMTPEAESDGDSLLDYAIAPLRSKFTVDGVTNNQNVSDFYDLREELTTQSKKSDATDENILQNKYINSVNAELSELYEQKREIQNSDLSNSEKYKQAREIQSQINDITENALSKYTNVSEYSNYSTVGDREYYKKINSEGETEWTKVDGDEAEDLNGLNMSNEEKNIYFSTKNEISQITRDTEDSDAKKSEIIDSILSSGMTDEQKAYLYGKHYSSDETLDKVTNSGISFDNYLTYQKDTLYMEDTESKVKHLYNADMDDKSKTVLYETSVLSGFDNEDKYKDYKTAKASGIDINSWLSYKKQEFVADKDSSGKSISGSRKEKIVSYINSLNLSIPQKAILIRQEYSSFDDYNNQIISYVDDLDISFDEKKTILESLDMEVFDDGTIRW